MKTKTSPVSKNLESGLLKPKGISIPISEPRWIKKDNLICLSLTSSGAFGLKWMNGLKKDIRIGDEAYRFLAKQKQGVRAKETFELAFMHSSIFFSQEQHLAKAREYAHDLGLTLAKSEVFPLLCELFSYQSNAIKRPATIMLVHEEVLDKKGKPMLLTIELLDGSIRLSHHSLTNEEKIFKSNVYFVFATKCDA